MPLISTIQSREFLQQKLRKSTIRPFKDSARTPDIEALLYPMSISNWACALIYQRKSSLMNGRNSLGV